MAEASLLDGFHEDGAVRGWCIDGPIRLHTPPDGTTYIAVAAGTFYCDDHWLGPAMYAALPGSRRITGSPLARAMLVYVTGYRALAQAGGPLEREGRLRYIDGCTDSGLIGPHRQGDPCLNHLHFPPGIVQTLHTHPSVRLGLVARGRGLCRTPDGDFPLDHGNAFVIPTGAVHGFTTEEDVMDIIAFHPDSLIGPTDERHQMLEATLDADRDRRARQPTSAAA